MRPERLALRNIRAFTDLDLNLRDITAAALIGHNGAGKSTIAEGILRGLYSDGPTILPSSMIRLGADDGSIELEYVHNDQRFRVVRVGGKRSDLQYLISDGNGGWQPLSGATAAETQEKINASLAMDKDLFLNSCCVMQNDSAGLCNLKPAPRKALMYKIFERELWRFAALHDAAKKRVAELDNQLSAGRAKRTDLEEWIAAKSSYEQAKAEAADALAGLGQQLSEAEAELKKLQEQAARAKADQEKLESLNRQIEDLKREEAELQRRIDAHEQAVRECDELVSQADVIRNKCDRAGQLEEQLERHSIGAEKYSALGQAYVQATSNRDAEVGKLQAEKRQGLQELVSAQASLSAEQERVREQRCGVLAQVEVAERQASTIDQVPCKESPMAGECKLLAEARAARERLTGLYADAERLLAQVDGLQVDIDAKKQEIAAYDTLAAEMVEKARVKLQAEVDDIVRQKDALGYDKAEHQACLAEFNELKAWRDKLADLAAAETRADSAKTSLTADKRDLAEKQKKREDLQQGAVGLAGQSPKDTEFNIGYHDQKISQIRQQIDAATRTMASAETLLSQITQAEIDLKSLNDSLKDSEHQRLIFATLQEAYSRDGIPALIIDAAIPQIEEYANDLLKRLSDGRMSLRFATQKRVGSGSTAGIAETLDIFVSDGAGERAYEDFSGGEQLRVNLAVRIAIGQVLAQRHGATIRTLLLDEVCSPLDQAGEDALVECITKLQAMFDCILLVTHRDSLKDRLPQQIEVVKGSAGSEVRVA